MTKTLFVLSCAFLFLSCSTGSKPSVAPETEYTSLTMGQKQHGLEHLKQVVGVKEIEVYEGHLKANTKFSGFPLVELLNHGFGETWKNSDGILFTAMDGYRSDVSVEKILKYNPVLAFSFSDSTRPFMIDNQAQNEKNVDLGPYYLVWDNIKNPELRKTAMYGWPYQVDIVEPIQYSSYYAKAFPITNPTRDQKRGFELFKTYCMSCHSVSGEEGGAKGPVLYPNPSVIEKGLGSFRKWTLSPSKMKPGTTMPPLNTQLSQKERQEASRLIYLYLSALNKK